MTNAKTTSSIITSTGNGEYIAHDFHGELIATIKAIDGGFEVYHYGGKRHGKITTAKTMPDVVAILVDALMVIYKHAGSFFCSTLGGYERFEKDGARYSLCLSGEFAGSYTSEDVAK